MAWSRTWHRLRREIGRYRRSAPKLRKLGLRDWKDLVRAQLALMRAQREMQSLPTGAMVRDEDAPIGTSTGDRVDDARRIALAVNRAAAFGLLRPRCLVKSRALRKMLDQEGITGAQVRVGVQLSEGRFRAHAWVEYGGQVVGDDPVTVAQYVPMPGLRVAEIE
ncbi:MAG TPA: lasso peptide biosynthesis B2 protein [Gemmatimonadaceae bacterium]